MTSHATMHADHFVPLRHMDKTSSLYSLITPWHLSQSRAVLHCSHSHRYLKHELVRRIGIHHPSLMFHCYLFEGASRHRRVLESG